MVDLKIIPPHFFQEYFFGGGGIESCNPGGTQLGQPLKIEQVGEPSSNCKCQFTVESFFIGQLLKVGNTEIDAGMFMEYLQAQGRDRFRGDRYY